MDKLLFIATAFLLSSCVSHLSQEQCRTMDWSNVGYNDAASGRMPRDLGYALRDCGEYGISVNSGAYHAGWAQGARHYCIPDANLGYQGGQSGIAREGIMNRMAICDLAGIRLNLSKYDQGWQEGIADFCTYEQGVNFARMGKPFPEVCPAQLEKKFRAGWLSGKNQFCNQIENAFALGKSNQPYPSICTPELYIAFKSEYERGHAIAERMKQFQDRKADIERKISYKAEHYRFNPVHDGYFELGEDQSEDAKSALYSVNRLVREKQNMEKDYFNLQVLK